MKFGRDHEIDATQHAVAVLCATRDRVDRGGAFLAGLLDAAARAYSGRIAYLQVGPPVFDRARVGDAPIGWRRADSSRDLYVAYTVDSEMVPAVAGYYQSAITHEACCLCLLAETRRVSNRSMRAFESATLAAAELWIALFWIDGDTGTVLGFLKEPAAIDRFVAETRERGLTA